MQKYADALQKYDKENMQENMTENMQENMQEI